MRYALSLCLITFVPVVAAADDDDKKPAATQPIKVVKLDRKDAVVYEKDVEPILSNRCNVCHSGNIKEGRLDLGTYESMMKGGKRGKAVVPGNAEQSLLVRAAGRTHKPFMPPK